MQLSPLQSRLAASLVASCLLIALYFTLFSPHFALAAELESTPPILLDDLDILLDHTDEEGRVVDPVYEPEFAAFDRSILGRQDNKDRNEILDNKVQRLNIEAGQTDNYWFKVSEISTRKTPPAGEKLDLRSTTQDVQQLEQNQEPDNATGSTEAERRGLALGSHEKGERDLTRRQTRRIYISANTCMQPQPEDPSKTASTPPQLTLYVSTDPNNDRPGPLAADVESQRAFPFEEGLVTHELSTDQDVFIGIHAPNSSKDLSGIYNYKLSVSTKGFLFRYSEDSGTDLIWVDSDSQGALLVTGNLTKSNDEKVQQKVMSKAPYVMFAHNKKDRSIDGIRHSYCGLEQYAQIASAENGRFANMVTTRMTRRGPGNLPKQQFYFGGLNTSSEYVGILARTGDLPSTEGANLDDRGGIVYRQTTFQTKSDHGNCALILDLEFCDQVAYSAPSNSKNEKFRNSTDLARFYDGIAKTAYSFFEKALQQVPCEAPLTQRYSLVSNCSNCSEAYKEWLCSVTIPRCEDFSNTAKYLHPRGIYQPFPDGSRLSPEVLAEFKNTSLSSFTSSRNPRIDEEIKPGPYKELLPCDDLCYKLVQTCPSSMGFSCPLPGDKYGFEGSYHTRAKNGELTCNFQGSMHVKSGARRSAMVTSSSWVLLLSSLAVSVAGCWIPWS